MTDYESIARRIVDKWYPSKTQITMLSAMLRKDVADGLAQEIVTALRETAEPLEKENLELKEEIRRIVDGTELQMRTGQVIDITVENSGLKGTIKALEERIDSLMKCQELRQHQEQIVELQSRIRELEEALKMAIHQVEYVGCQQHCTDGVVQVGEDDIQQCQWCAELNRAKQALSKSRPEGGKQ
jgi:predicted RNase H-like nuclease (RuvC/YqgF family)